VFWPMPPWLAGRTPSIAGSNRTTLRMRSPTCWAHSRDVFNIYSCLFQVGLRLLK